MSQRFIALFKIIFKQFYHFKAQVYLLLMASCTLIFIAFFNLLQNNLYELKEEVKSQLNLAENYIYSSVSNAEQVMNGIAFLINKTTLTPNNEDIFSLINNFDPKPQKFKAIAFSSLVVLDKNNISVASSLNDITKFEPKDFSQAKCLYRTKSNPMKLQIGGITKGLYSEEEIIPLGISIFSNNNFKGTLCTGLSINSLKAHFKNSISSPFFNKINLLNRDSENLYKDNVDDLLHINTLLKHILFNSDIQIYKSLSDYPYAIHMSLNIEFIVNFLKAGIVNYLENCLAYIFFMVTVFFLIKRYYTKPFYLIKKSITPIQNKIGSNHLPIKIENADDLSPANLANIIADLTTHLKLIYEKEEREQFETYAKEIKQKVLNLALIEQHYSSTKNRIATAKEAVIYNNMLTTFIKEPLCSMSVNEYFDEITNYFNDCFYEFSVSITRIYYKEDREFTFKYTALTETIFHILTFILRTAILEAEDEVTIKPYFQNNDFPTIDITLRMSKSDLKPHGWETGAFFPYMSLLSIYLLAKENNLALSIKQKSSKLTFSLAPFYLPDVL